MSDLTLPPVVGPAGAAGIAGSNGLTWRSGNIAPDNAVGANGDYYLILTTGVVYQRSAGVYAVVANLKGSKVSYKFVYDFAVLGGATGSIALTQVDGPLPDKFIMQNVLLDVITPLGTGGAATAALTTGQGAGDLVAATLVAGVPWSTAGLKVTTILLGTIATLIKATAQRSPALVVAIAALNAGKFNLFVEGYLSD